MNDMTQAAQVSIVVDQSQYCIHVDFHGVHYIVCLEDRRLRFNQSREVIDTVVWVRRVESPVFAQEV